MAECIKSGARKRSSSQQASLIFANTINDLTYREITPASISLVDLFAFQELWLVEPGDVIVTARPLPEDFVMMVCHALGLSPSSFTRLSPNARPDEPLLTSIRHSCLLAELRTIATTQPNMKIRACALDWPLLQISEELALPIEGYCDKPSVALLETVGHLNTKSGFRDLAAGLDMRVADGFSNVQGIDVETAVRQTLSRHDEAIVKNDCGSGGSGQFRIIRNDMVCRSSLLDGLRAFVRRGSNLGHTFVVERCIPLQLDVTIDMEITDQGPRPLYVGAMDCHNGVFNGMSVPAPLSTTAWEDLHAAANRLGGFLFKEGYRGFFDIDGGLDPSGKLYLFEANVRRTSTSLWNAVLHRVAGDCENIQWCLSAETLSRRFDFRKHLDFTQQPDRSGRNKDEPESRILAWASSSDSFSWLALNFWRRVDANASSHEWLEGRKSLF
jgi:hypothetical protein